MFAIVLFAAGLLGSGAGDLPVLTPGASVSGSIEESDAAVETPAILASYSNAPVRGKRYRIELSEAGGGDARVP